MSSAAAPSDVVVLIGGGAAAHAAIAAYRADGGRGRLVMVSADDRFPYFRPALSKEFLRGDQDDDDLALEDDGWYRSRGVEARLATPVTALDVDRRVVTIAGADPISWTACLLATGSRAVRPDLPGADDPGVLTLRSAADAAPLLELARERRQLVVIGSGFLGCEVASGLALRGCSVTMVGPEEAPNQARLGPEVAAIVRSWIVDSGVTVQLGTDGHRIERAGEGRWRVVHADDELDADAVVLATGAAPVVELAAAAGLAIESGGVAVGADLRAEAPGVLAAGDVAAARHPVAERRLRVEHWGDAQAMGAVAGTVLAGRHAAWASVPGFWSSIGERTLKQHAWGDGWDEVHVDSGDDGGFTAWYGAGGRLVGVVTHERDQQYERAADLITQGVPMAHVLAARH